jgi:hypothetical protein
MVTIVVQCVLQGLAKESWNCAGEAGAQSFNGIGHADFEAARHE